MPRTSHRARKARKSRRSPRRSARTPRKLRRSPRKARARSRSASRTRGGYRYRSGNNALNRFIEELVQKAYNVYRSKTPEDIVFADGTTIRIQPGSELKDWDGKSFTAIGLERIGEVKRKRHIHVYHEWPHAYEEDPPQKGKKWSAVSKAWETNMEWDIESQFKASIWIDDPDSESENPNPYNSDIGEILRDLRIQKSVVRA